MLMILVALMAGTLSGCLAGGLIASRTVRRLSCSLSVDHLAEDHGLDDAIHHAASQWAMANGRPEAAGLVADKLRLVYRLNQRRAARLPRRRWFR